MPRMKALRDFAIREHADLGPRFCVDLVYRGLRALDDAADDRRKQTCYDDRIAVFASEAREDEPRYVFQKQILHHAEDADVLELPDRLLGKREWREAVGDQFIDDVDVIARDLRGEALRKAAEVGARAAILAELIVVPDARDRFFQDRGVR